MKDRIYLLLTGLACAGTAWAFYYFLGEFSIHVMAVSALLVTISENLRLRRKVRQLEQAGREAGAAASAAGARSEP
jgi:hypothetical protein